MKRGNKSCTKPGSSRRGQEALGEGSAPGVRPKGTRYIYRGASAAHGAAALLPLLFFSLFSISGLFGQTAELPQAGQEPGKQPEQPEQAQELSRGFNNILLGMNMEEVKEELFADPNFNFRGDPDVSMMRTPNTSLIECRGYYYIDRASFQFIDDSLFTITIILDPKRIGHYAMFTSLTDTYGEPASLSPEKSRWENEEIIISLERPLRVKYMAKAVLEELQREQRKRRSMETVTRERFLEQF